MITKKNKMNYDHKKLSILLYHGVTRIESKGIENFSKKHIHEKIFFKQMKYLKKNFNVISMNEITYCNKNKIKLPKKSIAITFDDGFHNNFSVATPILNDLNLPCTFYICPGVIGTKNMFWVDEIEDCINLTQKRFIKIDLGKKTYSFALTTKKKKIDSINKIKFFCKLSPSLTKDKIINQLIDETQIIPNVNHSKNYAKANWKQVREVAKNDLFCIGGHSMNHDILSRQKKNEVSKDIEKSIKVISKRIKQKITHYSYPEGQKDHYNNRIINILKKNEIECCPSAMFGQNEDFENLFHLKRIIIGMKNVPKFKELF
jgi:peptidoglycan/xylan/chitin deacetylase (PgdA/CDA1 family)